MEGAGSSNKSIARSTLLLVSWSARRTRCRGASGNMPSSMATSPSDGAALLGIAMLDDQWEMIESSAEGVASLRAVGGLLYGACGDDSLYELVQGRYRCPGSTLSGVYEGVRCSGAAQERAKVFARQSTGALSSSSIASSPGGGGRQRAILRLIALFRIQRHSRGARKGAARSCICLVVYCRCLVPFDARLLPHSRLEGSTKAKGLLEVPGVVAPKLDLQTRSSATEIWKRILNARLYGGLRQSFDGGV